MYELIQLTDNDYYIQCPSNIGIVKSNGNNVVLIDSGSEKEVAKKTLRILEENNWSLQAVLITHSHADHIGGCYTLQEHTGCKIYANGLERIYSENTLLEPITLYGGFPFKDLKHKFLLAKNSEVLPITNEVLPSGMEIIPLPGHSFDMIGFISKDGTAFIADSISSRNAIVKYGIGFLWDVEKTIETLTYLEKLSAKRYLPTHSPVCTNITEIIELNKSSINNVKDTICELCAESVSFEELLQRIFTKYNLQMNAQQYVLIGSTIRSYLSSLYESGRLKFEFYENKMTWRAI